MVKRVILMLLCITGLLYAGAQTMQQMLQIGHANEIKGVQVIPASNLILSFDETKGILWEYNTGRKINEFNLYNDRRTEMKGAVAIPEKNLCISSIWHSDNSGYYSTLEWYTLDEHTFLFSRTIPVPDDTSDASYTLNGIRLSSNNKVLYAATAGHLFVLNAENGNLINSLQVPVDGLPDFTIDAEDYFLLYSTNKRNGLKMVWWNSKGSIKVGEKKIKEITEGSASVSHNHKWIAVGTQKGEVWLMKTADASIVKKFRLAKDMEVRDVYFTSDDRYLIAKCYESSKVMKINCSTGEITSIPLKTGSYSRLYIEEVRGKKQFIAANNYSFNLYDEEDGILLKSYESLVGQSFHLMNNRDGSLLLMDGEMIDLNTLKSRESEGYGDDVAFDPNSNGYYVPGGNVIELYSGMGQKQEERFVAPAEINLSDVAVSSDGKYISAHSYSNHSLYFFRQGDTSSIKKIDCGDDRIKANGYLTGTHNAWLMRNDNKISVFNLDSMKYVIHFTPGEGYQFNSTLAYNPTQQIIAYPEIIHGNRISFYSLHEKKFVGTFYDTIHNIANYIHIVYNPKTHHWIVLKSDATLQVLNDSFVCIGQKTYGQGANTFCLDTVSRKIYLASDEGYTNCWKYDTLESELQFCYQIVSVRKRERGREFVFRTLSPNWYYFAPKTSIAAFHYVKGFRTYPYDQFDFALNQPAEVLKAASSKDTALISLYERAFRKAQMGQMDWNERFNNFFDKADEIPSIRILNREKIPPVTSRATVDIDFGTLFHGGSEMKGIYFTVNRVPVKWIGGKDLYHTYDSLMDNESAIRLTFKLQEGKNTFRFKLSDQNGLESFTESIEVIYHPQKPVKPKIYFIGIAVSEYKDAAMNLKYAVKDIRDLVAVYRRYADSLHVKLEVDTLLNASATRENILKLQSKLMKTDVEDIIIWAISGHGLLDDSLDFYYATWDCDFRHPQEKGIRYEALEKLIKYAPARHRLMLMDACHSGAIDKERLYVKKENQGNDTLQAYAVKGSQLLVDSSSVALDNSFELMRMLFDDFTKDNGIEVISASAGSEYALESDAWHNGVFSYSIMEGLRNRNADTNKDGKISVNELKTYVSRRVVELTQGKQNPGSRKENPESDWFVF